MLVNSDCSAMWFKDTKIVEEALKVKSTLPTTPTFEPDIQHWQIPISRRFRALKLWFVLRIYGVEGIQNHIRHQIGLAKFFERLTRTDDRFEVCISSMGLVCFRLKGDDSLTRALLDGVSKRKKIFLMPYIHRNKLVVRFVICSRFTQKDDILFAWKEIVSVVEEEVYSCAKSVAKKKTLKQQITKKSKSNNILNRLDPSNIRSTV